MARQFYTEQDIEDMVKRGATSLEVNEGVSLTALAYEKARRLGLTLVQKTDSPPSAPLRPYLSPNAAVEKVKACSGQSATSRVPAAGLVDLKERIRQAVLQKLGNQVDPALLDKVIERVLSSTGMDKG